MSKELLENEAFVNGIIAGITLHQQKVIFAHKRNELLRINDELFFLQDGRERLQEALEKICR